jgi:hypothetical protein
MIKQGTVKKIPTNLISNACMKKSDEQNTVTEYSI